MSNADLGALHSSEFIRLRETAHCQVPDAHRAADSSLLSLDQQAKARSGSRKLAGARSEPVLVGRAAGGGWGLRRMPARQVGRKHLRGGPPPNLTGRGELGAAFPEDQ